MGQWPMEGEMTLFTQTKKCPPSSSPEAHSFFQAEESCLFHWHVQFFSNEGQNVEESWTDGKREAQTGREF
jgi:hypothetical protein